MSIVKDIMRYESGKMSKDEIPAFFQRLVDSRVLFKLQKDYRRYAVVLHLKGLIRLVA